MKHWLNYVQSSLTLHETRGGMCVAVRVLEYTAYTCIYI